MKIEIIYQDDVLIAINKPNNILVHSSHYARNLKGPTLVDLLEKQLGKKVYPIHRLDHKTSGLLIFGLNSLITKQLQEQFIDNSIQKRYLALLRGHVDGKGIIDTPVQNPDTKKYKEALTNYICLEKVVIPIPVQPYSQSRYSLVIFEPKTGRMHQLRKHANKISHPIIGDHKYGNRHHNKMFADQLEFPHLFLHAFELQFTHPITKEKLNLKTAPPEFWNKALTELGFTKPTF